MWLLKVLRLIFVTLDNAIYQLVDWLYQLFMLLAETGIFTSEAIRAFSERIYFFLGLIMVFKVSVSLLQYILNPDAVNDGKIGASKLLKNIVFVLVGIIFVPYVFDAAFSLQRIVLKDNIIGNLILGTNLSGKGESPEDVIKETGDIMAFSTFTAFFNFNRDYITVECSAQPFDITRGNKTLAQPSDICVGSSTKNNEDMVNILKEFYDSKAGDLYTLAYESNNMHRIAAHMKVFNYTFENEEGDDTFLFDYTLLVTSAGGLFLAYVLLVFCFDVAVRAVKLGFLQLIAPIPLIAKIDPKKGDEVFNKWVKECTSTYLNLFIRLIAIYFALYIITLVTSIGVPFNVVTKEDIYNPLVIVFIIFGVLLFVKDLPKLIETLTGMKINTSGFGIKNKLGQVPLVGGKLANGLARAEGVARGAGRKALKNAGAGIAKTVSGNTKGTNLSGAGSKFEGKAWAKKIDDKTGRMSKNWNDKFRDFEKGRLGQAIKAEDHFKNLGEKARKKEIEGDRLYQDRVAAGRREGMEREKASGLMGDSGYKGSTIGKILSQAKYKEQETDYENSEKARRLSEKMQRGGSIHKNVTDATDYAKGYAEGYGMVGLEKEHMIHDAKANILFGQDEELKKEFVYMSDAKFTRDEAKNIAAELSAQYERGEISNYAIVKEAEVNAAKASSAYDKANASFTTMLNGRDRTVIEDYEAYTAYDDRHKDGSLSKWAEGPDRSMGNSTTNVTNITNTTTQQTINDAAGVGYRSSDHGAPTTDTSIFNDGASYGNVNGVQGAPVNATISEEAMMQMAQVMSEAYSQTTAAAMKDALKDVGKQMSQELGNTVSSVMSQPFNELNQNMKNMTDSFAQMEKTQRETAEIIGENTDAIEAQRRAIIDMTDDGK